MEGGRGKEGRREAGDRRHGARAEGGEEWRGTLVQVEIGRETERDKGEGRGVGGREDGRQIDRDRQRYTDTSVCVYAVLI